MRCAWMAVAMALIVQVAAGADADRPAAAEPFLFREPLVRRYRVAPEPVAANRPALQALGGAGVRADLDWIEAWPEGGSAGRPIEFGRRIVVQLGADLPLAGLLEGSALRLARQVAPAVFILEAPSARVALGEAQRLARLPGVLASVPVSRRPKRLQGLYSRLPSDPYFPRQWHLENRNLDGTPAGADLNVRGAWPYSGGEGVIIAFGDDGIELTHPEFITPADGAPHYNFAADTPNGMPMSSFSIHGTAVAGLAAAQGNNEQGVSGVAPAARIASWVIFNLNDDLISDERLMDMFQYRSNIVSVQNHSWANADIFQFSPSLLEQVAISNAVTFGRSGKGVVMVRAGGNYRENGGNANDDGYPSNPQVIGVAAVRNTGRATSYSNPGACLLVAAPSGDIDKGYPALFSTDRMGQLGYNQIAYTNDLADYTFDAYGFSGTSAATPQIAGLCALILAANPELHVRDVQQILALSGRHYDFDDPDLHTNGAGIHVSHNAGFGVPDAGEAVRLARSWRSRPAAISLVFTATNSVPIPNDALRVMITGDGGTNLASIPATPGAGPHPDEPTAAVPLIDAGLAGSRIELNLTNQAALIGRDGSNLFRTKIEHAAEAGARFAIIYNHQGDFERLIMGETDFSPIPAVLIGRSDGEYLRSLVRSNGQIRAQLEAQSARCRFDVTNSVLCEHVSVQLQTDHPARGDLRIAVLSPQGTRSILQRISTDTNSTLSDWTYRSVHHFFESSVGSWTVEVTDEGPYPTGSIKLVRLEIRGVPITDSDADGLDDGWELSRLNTLVHGPGDDPDLDGFSNAREQLAGTDPVIIDIPFQVDLAVWNTNVVRLSWSGNPHFSYEILAGTNSASPSTVMATIPGKSPQTEWFTPLTNMVHRFFRVRALRPQVPR